MLLAQAQCAPQRPPLPQSGPLTSSWRLGSPLIKLCQEKAALWGPPCSLSHWHWGRGGLLPPGLTCQLHG